MRKSEKQLNQLVKTCVQFGDYIDILSAIKSGNVNYYNNVGFCCNDKICFTDETGNYVHLESLSGVISKKSEKTFFANVEGVDWYAVEMIGCFYLMCDTELIYLTRN